MPAWETFGRGSPSHKHSSSSSGLKALPDSLVWSLQGVDGALRCLAQQSGWPVADVERAFRPGVEDAGAPLPYAPAISQAAAPGARVQEDTIARHIQRCVRPLNLEVEPVTATYRDAERLVQEATPTLLRLPGPGHAPGFLALLRSDRRGVYLIDTDHQVQRVSRQAVIDAMWADLTVAHRARIKPLLEAACALSSPNTPNNGWRASKRAVSDRASVSGQASVSDDESVWGAGGAFSPGIDKARERIERALLAETLGAGAQRGGWLLRLSPGSPLRLQVLEARVPRALGLLLFSYSAQLALGALAWWLIGRSALSGNFTWVGMWAWALLLVTTVPFQQLAGFAQRQVGLRMGELFKVRLLQGALNLQPEVIRHQGVGALLGRALAADVVERVSLAGGFVALLSVLQLALAGWILALGAPSALQGGGSAFWLIWALPLGGWLALLAFLSLRYGARQDAMMAAHNTLANDLVERMVGHRTRLAQEDPAHWHDEEDEILQRYVRLQVKADRAGGRLSLLPRGWMVVGVAGLVYGLMAQQTDTAQLAITLGGILLAFNAFSGMIVGMQGLFDISHAWRNVQELFVAAKQEGSLPPRDHRDNVARPVREQNQNYVGDSFGGGLGDGLGAAPGQEVLLKADGLNYRYDERSEAVLRNVRLNIAVGERLLLTGPSGGGKSTLAALLAGLRPAQDGRLTLWGHDQRHVDVSDWRQRILLVPQFHENYVLTGTLAFNLLMGRRWPPTGEDLRDAERICREVGLGELIDRMPAGLEQMVGESGWRLSHGERSRVFVARALLQEPDLLILDESFGALDAVSMQATMAAVRRRAKTLLVIAHP